MAAAESANASDHITNAAVAAPAIPSQAQLRRQRRLERYQQVVDLFHSGHSQVAISDALGIGRKTVRRWLRRGQFPERTRPHRLAPKVSQFGDYLHQRRTEGCHNASRLYQEIRQKGYAGKRSMVARFVPLSSPGTFGLSESTLTQPDGTTSARQIQLALKLIF